MWQQSLKVNPGYSPDVTWEIHMNSGNCQPKSEAPKDICPARRCRKKLTSANSTTWPRCGLQICIQHRHPDDHQCIYGDKRLNQASSSAARPVQAMQNQVRNDVQGGKKKDKCCIM